MKFLSGIFILALLGCATSQKNQSLKESFDLIKLGDTPNIVTSKVGEPQQKYEKTAEIKWYYSIKNPKILYSEVSFSTNKKVELLIVYPQQEGDEDQLNALLDVKFKGVLFVNLKKVNCQKDYYFSNEFFINKEIGLVVMHNMKRKFVEYYAYQSLEDINNLEKAFNNCLLKKW